FLLSRLWDGDVAAAQADAVRTRMEREPELREAFAALTSVNELLVARRSDAASVDFADLRGRIMADVESSRRPGTFRIYAWRWAGGLMAAAAAVALFLTL